MKTRILLIGLMLLPACGCTGMNNTQQGAVTGGLLGGGIGLLAGGRHPLVATAIGATAGTVLGGAVGASEDRREDRQKAVAIAAANAQAQRQMSINEVVQMSQQGISDSLIVRQIDSTNSVFNLTSDDINFLHQQRVSDGVISYMQARRYPRPIVVREVYGPVYGPPPPVYVEPGFSVGVGIRR